MHGRVRVHPREASQLRDVLRERRLFAAGSNLPKWPPLSKSSSDCNHPAFSLQLTTLIIRGIFVGSRSSPRARRRGLWFQERESHCEFHCYTTVRVSFLPCNDRTSKPFGFGGSGVKRAESLTAFRKEHRGSTFESPSLIRDELAGRPADHSLAPSECS